MRRERARGGKGRGRLALARLLAGGLFACLIAAQASPAAAQSLSLQERQVLPEPSPALPKAEEPPQAAEAPKPSEPPAAVSEEAPEKPFGTTGSPGRSEERQPSP